MAKESGNKNQVSPVSPAEYLQLRDALSMKYGFYLRPGESLSITAERTAQHAHALVSLSAGDDSVYVEVEAACVPEDQDVPAQWDAEEALALVVDLIDIQLENFFAEERVPRFHDDWRPYDLEGSHLRLRGVHTRPNLEALADEWLASAPEQEAEGEDN